LLQTSSTSTPFPYTTLFRSKLWLPILAAIAIVIIVVAIAINTGNKTTTNKHEDPTDKTEKNADGEKDKESDEKEPEDTGIVNPEDRKSTRLNSSHVKISYAV